MQSKKPPFRANAVFAIFLAFSLAIGSPSAQAKTKFKVLHTFHGKDGSFPIAQLTLDDAGNIYGSTGSGRVAHLFQAQL